MISTETPTVCPQIGLQEQVENKNDHLRILP